jgi:ubiquinone/menaquinone biosynthesis C-methylase UbiE
MNSPKNIIARYDKFPKWGRNPDDANWERIVVTQSLIPNDVGSILDLGCGDGAVTNQLAEKGFRVVGADFSSIALSFVKGERVVSSVDSTPFPDQHFDLVLCAETIEHLPEGIYEKTLSEIERVAGRYIIISTPNKEYLPSSNVKCKKCKNVYHRSLHTRSFDRVVHRALFQKFELDKTIGVRNWNQAPLVADFQQKILNVYTPGHNSICPFCGHINSVKPGIWQRLIFRVGHIISPLVPGAKNNRWIVSLYERSTLK